ncbi:hypothetical protein BDV34DRAFT_237097 [Aspergillus parasiticus]|uniref:GXWXG protein n=2 Tax=Aspergillus subgen. Circumdati TaxID=2720871 RepID=A0A5N6DB79_ASPPA|nr:hypothetical protein BDV34DRAFT_237097 [Aspergillus parasiticus]KAE8313060.1 hypothetical protein BDV41DRAFT_588385 [Aspergillus transmontanensis]
MPFIRNYFETCQGKSYPPCVPQYQPNALEELTVYDRPEEQFIKLTKATDLVPESTVEDVYNQLKPVPPSFLIGKWNGGDIDTGHIGHKLLKEMKWAGKDFRSVDDGDPIMVHDAEGNRIWKEDWGHCSLREMVYRGVTSTAMIYDQKPIFDHFRYVTDDMVAGAMDTPKLFGAKGTYYFYLTRRSPSSL